MSNWNLTKMIWTRPKQFGPDQNNLGGPKSFWTYRRTGQWHIYCMYLLWLGWAMMTLCYFKSLLRYNNQGNIFKTLLFVEGQCLFKSSIYLDKAMHSNVWNVYFLFICLLHNICFPIFQQQMNFQFCLNFCEN